MLPMSPLWIVRAARFAPSQTTIAQAKAPAHPSRTPGGWEAQGRPRGRGGSCFKPHCAVALVVGPSTSSRCRRRCVLSDARMIREDALLTKHSLTPGLSTPAVWSLKSQGSKEARNCPFPASRGGSIHHRPLPSGSRMTALICATPREPRRSIRLVPPMFNRAHHPQGWGISPSTDNQTLSCTPCCCHS